MCFSNQTSTLAPGSYNLIMNAYDTVNKTNYEEVQALVYRKKKFSSFIYTDKGMYKPGDTVNIACFCLDSETRPYNPQSGSVSFYDSDNIKIKTFANVSIVKGKFKASLILTDLAAEGIWRVNFDAEGQVSKQFV